MKCRKCNQEAIIYQKYSNAHLCREHFIGDVERKVKRDIRKFRMIGRGEKIAIGLSGGKDSMVLLFILHKIFHKRPDLKLHAITIDEGVADYREHTIPNAENLCKELDVPLGIFSFKKEFKITLDELTKKKENASCTLCGVLRKNVLNKAAREIGADKLAIGHNLDDESQTIMMNYLRGDVDRMGRMNGVPQQGLVLRIKPLRSIPEKEVALYAFVNNLPVNPDECPYAGEALRNEIREMVNDFEVKHPGTKYSLLRGFEKISKALKPQDAQVVVQCNVCGEPSSETLCKTCKLLGRQ